MTTETRVLSGRYRVDDLIGRGGMASVYRGYDQTLGRTVAIKILKSDLAGDAAFRTRFRLEAQAASRMAHPTIVRVFDAGEDAETTARRLRGIAPQGGMLPAVVVRSGEGTADVVLSDGSTVTLDAAASRWTACSSRAALVARLSRTWPSRPGW